MTTDYNNGTLTLIVEDTGTGMTEDEQQRFLLHLKGFQCHCTGWFRTWIICRENGL